MANKPKNPIFAIITDFGFDFSVASMKALILQKFPDAQIIDIDHSIKQYSVLSGAFVIDKIYTYFPEKTFFICVVDPGVGSKREPILLDVGSQKFIGPNNGLFHYILRNAELSCKSYVIKEKFVSLKSTTFHGRDIFTPAAIEIAMNNYNIVKPINKKKLIFLPILDSGKTIITYIDGFGNIKTNVSIKKNFAHRKFLKVVINDALYQIKISNTFSDVANGELLCYKGSNETLEIAGNLVSAENILTVRVGDTIRIEQ